MSPGPIALVGGGEFSPDCSFDAALLKASGSDVVTLLATAAAYENPSRLVERGREHFAALGATVESIDVYARPDANSDAWVTRVRNAKFFYLTDGSPMHLKSVLRESALFEALGEAWENGATIAASGASAMALCNPMVDPRGGAFTVGLALLEHVALIPHHDTWTHDRVKRTLALAPDDVTVFVVDEATAAIRDGAGKWSAAGVGTVVARRGGDEVSLNSIAHV